MSRQILAIDIRHSSIAAILLSTSLKSTAITACHHVPIPDGEQLGSALEQLSRKVSGEIGDIVVSLPADRTIYRTLRVPFKEEKKIRQILPFELEPTLPVNVDQLIIDYIQYTGAPEGELMTASVDRQYVDDLKGQLGEVGLQPQLIVPGDFPLASVIAGDERPADKALFLSMGELKTTLTLLDSGKVALVRSMAADGTTEKGMETLALKVRQTLIAYGETAPNGFSPDALFITGPAFRDPETVQRLETSLEMKPEIVDLCKSTSFLDTAPPLDAWEATVFSGALALALVESEHLPCPSFHRTGSTLRNYWISYKQYIRGPAILLAVVLILGFGNVLFESHLLQNRVDDLDRQMEEIFKETFPQARRVGDAGDQMKSELKKARTGNIDSGETIPKASTVDVLKQISDAIPKETEVLFTRLVLGGDVLTLSGETAAFNIVDDIKNRLEKAELFKAVTIASANMEKSGKKVRFKLKLTL